MKMEKQALPVYVSFEDFLNEDQSTDIKKDLMKKGKKTKTKTSAKPPKITSSKTKLCKNPDNTIRTKYGKRESVSINKTSAKRIKSDNNSEVIYISDSSFSNSFLKETKKKNSRKLESNKSTPKKSKQTKLVLKAATTKHKKCSNDVIVMEAGKKMKIKNKVVEPLKNSVRKDLNQTKAMVNQAMQLPAEEYLPWTEKYQPSNSKDLIGNKSAISKFVKWLEDWRERIEKEKKYILKQNHKIVESKDKCSGYNSDSDFYLSDEELFEEDNLLRKVYVIVGSTGCGKTATVYACAKEIGFKILELNASSTRGNKQIMGELKEATQSHLISKQQSSDLGKSKVNSFANYFKPKKIEKEIQSANENLDQRNSLILFDEAEAVLEQDKGFWPAVQSFIKISKRPIVISTSDISTLNIIDANYHQLHLKSSSSTSGLIEYLENIAEKEHTQVTKSDFQNLCRTSSNDIRQCISQLQFWSEDLSQKVLTKSQKPKKRRRKSKVQSPEKMVLDLHKRLSMLSIRRFGIYDDILSLFNMNGDKNYNRIFDIFCNMNKLNPGSFKYLERILSSLSSQGDFFLKYRMELLTLPCFKKPAQNLSYTVVQDENLFTENIFDPEVDFEHGDLLNLAFNQPYAYPDLLKDETTFKTEAALELSCDDNSNSSCSLFVNSNFTPDKHLSKVKDNELEMLHYPKEKLSEKLKCFSNYFDAISQLDCLNSSSLMFQYSRNNFESCRVVDSNLDEPSSDGQFLNSTFFDIQSSLQILALDRAQKSLFENNKTKTNCQYFNVNSECIVAPRCYKKLFTCSKLNGNTVKNNFILDFLPNIREICRSEISRKNCRMSRRFLHYFEKIHFYQQPHVLQLLANEFEPKIKLSESK